MAAPENEVITTDAVPAIMDDPQVPANLEDIGTSLIVHTDDEAEQVLKSAYLARLQFCTSASSVCKSGDFPINHYAYIRDQSYQDLGSTVDVIVLTWRPKALRMGATVISAYDPTDEEFVKIQEDAKKTNSGCMYGMDFLVYIPNIDKFATFFCGNASLRREATSIKASVGSAITLDSREAKNDKGVWYTPISRDCSTEFTLPSMATIKEVAHKFNNPPKSEIETVSDDEVSSRER